MAFSELNLPLHWECKTLSECTISGNISYGIVQPGQHDPNGIGIIRVNNFQNDQLDTNDVLKVTSEVESKFAKTRLNGGEVLLTLVGSTGLSVVVPPELKGWNVARAVAVIQPNEDVSADWINICLQSPYSKYFLDARANTTVQKTLNLKDVKEIPIPLPPISERKQIESLLVSLKNKIILNRQINQTLEQMAQTLFKSWFVDFDPVIDNALDAGNEIPEPLQTRAELRQKVRASQDFQPLPANIRVLFPAEFKESELGWVPKGWMVKAADEISTISIGKTPPRVQTQWFSESNVGNVTWISIKDMGNCGVFTKGSSEYLVQEGVDKFNVKIVPKDSVILSFKLTLGRVSITSCDLTTNEAIAHFVSPKMGLTKEFIYCYLSSFDYGSLGSTSSIATAVNSKIIKQMPFIVPHIQISSLFEKKVCTFFQKLRSLAEETEALTQLRDTLLPKLISGELRLDEIPTP